MGFCSFDSVSLHTHIIYIYIYIHIYIYTYIHIHIYIYKYIYTDIYIYICIYIYIHTHIRMCIYIYICVCVYMHACMHTCMYTCMHTLFVWGIQSFACTFRPHPKSCTCCCPRFAVLRDEQPRVLLSRHEPRIGLCRFRAVEGSLNLKPKTKTLTTRRASKPKP